MNRKLIGDGTWPWLDVAVEGDDIVCRSTPATWFGGDSDPMDSGETASGILTRGHPALFGCALPMNVPHSAATKGSPIPRVPWKTVVRVFCHETHKVVEVPVIDLGPGKRTRHGLDLTVAAFEALGVNQERGILRVDYRILGGARFVAPD